MKAKQTNGKKFFEYRFCHFFIMMLIFSALGYMVELVFRAVDLNVINSGNHIFPLTFAYGLICLAIYGVLGTPDSMRIFNVGIFRGRTKGYRAVAYAVYFTVLGVGILLGELFFGNLYYNTSGYAIWNYNAVPLNIRLAGCPYAFTSVPTTLAFAAAGFAFMKFAFNPIMRGLEKLPVKQCVIFCAVAGTLIAADFIFDIAYMQVYGATPLYWQIEFGKLPFKIFINTSLFP